MNERDFKTLSWSVASCVETGNVDGATTLLAEYKDKLTEEQLESIREDLEACFGVLV